MGADMLYRADRTWYGDIVENILNNFAKGNKNHPPDTTEDCSQLVNCISYDTNQHVYQLVYDLEEIFFINLGGKKRKTFAGKRLVKKNVLLLW